MDRQAIELLQQILAELRGLRADNRRQRNEAPALVAALTECFGPGRFTTRGLLALADEEPHSELASALSDSIDMNALPRSRATALGSLLTRLPEVELVAQQRGVAVYRLRTSEPEVL